MELKEKNENVEDVKDTEIKTEGEITDDAAEAAAGGVKPTRTP